MYFTLKKSYYQRLRWRIPLLAKANRNPTSEKNLLLQLFRVDLPRRQERDILLLGAAIPRKPDSLLCKHIYKTLSEEHPQTERGHPAKKWKERPRKKMVTLSKLHNGCNFRPIPESLVCPRCCHIKMVCGWGRRHCSSFKRKTKRQPWKWWVRNKIWGEVKSEHRNRNLFLTEAASRCSWRSVPVLSPPWRLRLGDREFKVSLSYTVKPIGANSNAWE